MSYTKTNWHDGDTITAVKMNKIENGIESSLSTELQSLYKTLVGKDYEGDPNSTDAEMIDAIAKDATSGESGITIRAVGTSNPKTGMYTLTYDPTGVNLSSERVLSATVQIFDATNETLASSTRVVEVDLVNSEDQVFRISHGLNMACLYFSNTGAIESSS